MSEKVKKPKKPKGQAESETLVTTLLPFNQLGAAFAVISSAVALKEQGMDVAFAGGSEPPLLNWLRERGERRGYASQRAKSPQTNPAPDDTTSSSYPSSFPSFDDVPTPVHHKEILDAEAAEG